MFPTLVYSAGLCEASGELGLINLNPLPSGREASLGTRKTARERPTAAAVVDYGYEILYPRRQEVFFLFDLHNLTHHLEEDAMNKGRHTHSLN